MVEYGLGGGTSNSKDINICSILKVATQTQDPDPVVGEEWKNTQNTASNDYGTVILGTQYTTPEKMVTQYWLIKIILLMTIMEQHQTEYTIQFDMRIRGRVWYQ